MDDNMQDKITEIGKMLGIEGIPENAGAILNAFLSGSGETERTEEPEETIIEVGSKSDPEENPSPAESSGPALHEILTLMETYKTITGEIKNDEKARLLQSLKPFLNSTRQEKVGNCMKFLAAVRFLEHKEELSAVGGKFFSF